MEFFNMRPETWKYLRDQSAHFWSNWLFSILAIFPFTRNLVVVVWAITREYYQHRLFAFDFFENLFQLNFKSTDLKWSYAGNVFGMICEAGFWYWLITSGHLKTFIIFLGG